jgi:hypothetical protein
VNKGEPRPPGSTVYLRKKDCECVELGLNCGSLSLLSAAECGRICIRESEFDPEKHELISGPYDDKEECEAKCCAKEDSSSSSESSSSSCECKNIQVEIKTDGCCLYLGPSGVEAVGSGTVSATLYGEKPEGCDIKIKINGKENQQMIVEDGEKINIDIQTEGTCDCCEIERECSSKSSELWIQKSNKEKKTIVLDKEAIRSKVRLAIEKVRKRKRS